MSDNKLRTAILQLDLVENNIDFNLGKIRTQALALKTEQPDLIIIPEIAVEGDVYKRQISSMIYVRPNRHTA